MMVNEIGCAGDDLGEMLWNGENNYSVGCRLSNLEDTQRIAYTFVATSPSK